MQGRNAHPAADRHASGAASRSGGEGRASGYMPALGIVVVMLLIGGLSFVFYRSVYAHNKRLRAIVPGKIYRSGQMTAEGFAEAVREHGIRTIVNLQNDDLDPDVAAGFRSAATIKESELCARLGVRFVAIAPDLVPHSAFPDRRPEAVDQFLQLMDAPDIYPVLIHCKAGLHRTGCLAAVWRMEYQGWTPREAFQEMKGHGFGQFVCDAANDYVSQYVLSYRRGQRFPAGNAARRP
jgi:tyrosine-protein phosphatase SIW14